MGLKEFFGRTAVNGGVAVAQATSDATLSAEIALRLHEAKKHSASIAELSKKLAGPIGFTVACIAIVAQTVVDEVEKDPRDYKVIRSFFDYNLGKAKDVIEARHTLEGIEGQEENIAKVDTVIDEILVNFKDFVAKCHANDSNGAQIAAETLSRIMKANI